MSIVDDYLKAKQAIFDHCGYVEDWRVIPLDDCRELYWRLDGEGYGGTCRFAETVEQLDDEDGNYYEDDIYTQRHLPKWVYRGAEYTIVCCDPHVDGNTFLRIFNNTKESP